MQRRKGSVGVTMMTTTTTDNSAERTLRRGFFFLFFFSFFSFLLLLLFSHSGICDAGRRASWQPGALACYVVPECSSKCPVDGVSSVL